MARTALLVALAALTAATARAADVVAALSAGAAFSAEDTLAAAPDARDDANACLAGLTWPPSQFEVRLERTEPNQGAWLVRFPSPRPVGNATSDLVAMEWHPAKHNDGALRKAKAVIVVHESGRNMQVGRLIARTLSWQGLHAFMLHLPGYGARRVEGLATLELALPVLQQGIADVRRARDAVAALPMVDDSVVGVEGTSLGGFVTASVAGLDRGYDRVFILLAGGDLHEVIMNGAKDAAKFREKLARAGVTNEQIRRIAYEVEPLRLAHRVDPASTWLYSGKLDDVAPPRCAHAFAKAARLRAAHHIELDANHYSGIIYLPQIVSQIAQHMEAPLEPLTAQPPAVAAP